MKHALQAFTRSCLSLPLHLSPPVCELSMAARSLECKIYQSELQGLGKGLPLYDPTPSRGYHVHVGDVGYIHDGKFRPCFNIFQNSEDTMAFNRENGVPDMFVPVPLYYTYLEDRAQSPSGSVFKTVEIQSIEGNLQTDIWCVNLLINIIY